MDKKTTLNNQENSNENSSKIKDRDIKIEITPKIFAIILTISLVCCGIALLLSKSILLAVQVLLLSALLAYVSAVDVKLHLAPNWVSYAIAILALPTIVLHITGKEYLDLVSMGLGLLAGFLPLFLGAVFTHGGVGGADIKIMAALGLFMGFDKTFVALIIGLGVSIIFTLIQSKVKKMDKNRRIALLPFLSIGSMIAILNPII